jgi:Tol biopolymer transport system component
VNVESLTNEGDILAAALSRDGSSLAYVTERQRSTIFRSVVGTPGSEVWLKTPGDIDDVAITPDGDLLFSSRGTRENLGLFRWTPHSRPARIREEWVGRFDLSPDGTRVVYAQYASDHEMVLQVADLRTGHVARVASKAPEGIRDPAWSPDGKSILFHSEGDKRLTSLDVATREETDPARLSWNLVVTARWAGDSSFLAVRGFQETSSALWKFLPGGIVGGMVEERELGGLFNLLQATDRPNRFLAIRTQQMHDLWLQSGVDGYARQRTRDGLNGQYAISWTKTGTLLYACGLTNICEIGEGWLEPGVLMRGPGVAYWPAESSDGTFIVVARRIGDRQMLWRIDRAGNPPRQLTHGAADSAFAISPDSQRIAYVVMGKDERTGIHIMDADGGNPRFLVADHSRSLRFSPDGQWLYYAREVTDDDLWRVHVATGKAESLDLTDVERFEFSPNGKLLACARSDVMDADVTLLDARTGGVVRDVELPSTFVAYQGIRWCPDSTCFLFMDKPEKGGENVFSYSLATGEHSQVTQFDNDRRLVQFEVSRDGKQFAFTRSLETSDAVFLTIR